MEGKLAIKYKKETTKLLMSQSQEELIQQQ